MKKHELKELNVLAATHGVATMSMPGQSLFEAARLAAQDQFTALDLTRHPMHNVDYAHVNKRDGGVTPNLPPLFGGQSRSKINQEAWDAIKQGTIVDKRKLIGALLQALRTKKVVHVEAGDKKFAFSAEHDHTPEEWTTNERVFEMMLWTLGPYKLEKPQGSKLHDFQEAINGGRFWRLMEAYAASAPKKDNELGSAFDTFVFNAPLYLVEHDWSAALKAPVDGDLMLPFQELVLELRISGKRVLVMVADGSIVKGGRHNFLLVVEYLPGKWTGAGSYFMRDDGAWDWGRDHDHGNEISTMLPQAIDVANLIGQQLRAICIAVEAEIAETEVVRAPHKLNHEREKRGKLPLHDYHVVNLARRHRIVPMERLDDPDRPKRRSPRLHYRRGHWRYYPNHKVRIHWQLVGDPDLGYIDKEYRL